MILSWIFFGMGLQAAITAALFPEGAKAEQQLVAAIIFMLLSILCTVVTTLARR